MPLKYDTGFLKSLHSFLRQCSAFKRPEVHDVATRRDNSRLLAKLLNSQTNKGDVVIAKHRIDVDDATISVYQFTKGSVHADLQPTILHCHGGGMIAGDVNMFKGYLAGLVSETGVQIFSVDYRLAPESRGISLTNDCFQALLWLHENSKSLHIDTRRIAVMGESAGGGLAAGVALMARDKHLRPPLASQILIEPMLDDRNTTPTRGIDEFCLLWSWEDNITGWTAVLGDQAGSSSVSPYIAPARATSLVSLPPTYIDVGQLDIFAEEITTYAARLMKEGVAVDLHVYSGLPHGFEMLGKGNLSAMGPTNNRRRAIRSI